MELSSQDGHDQQNNLAHGGLETKYTKVSGSNVEGGARTNSQEADFDYLLSRDTAKRNIKTPDRFSFADLIALLTAMEYEESEPLFYQEAINNKESMKWLIAMSEEFESLQKNQTWVLVERNLNKKVVSCKWIFKRKQGAIENEPIRFKARLVARGYT